VRRYTRASCYRRLIQPARMNEQQQVPWLKLGFHVSSGCAVQTRRIRDRWLTCQELEGYERREQNTPSQSFATRLSIFTTPATASVLSRNSADHQSHQNPMPRMSALSHLLVEYQFANRRNDLSESLTEPDVWYPMFCHCLH